MFGPCGCRVAMGHGGPGRLANMDIFWLVDVRFGGTLRKFCLRKLTL